jgi:hypothetical protein
MVTPEPARFPRKALNLRFAVLLMVGRVLRACCLLCSAWPLWLRLRLPLASAHTNWRTHQQPRTLPHVVQRSSFDAVNALDFIPMDSFEVGVGVLCCAHVLMDARLPCGAVCWRHRAHARQRAHHIHAG